MKIPIIQESVKSDYNKIQIAIECSLFGFFSMSQSDKLEREDWFNIDIGDELGSFSSEIFYSKKAIESISYNIWILSLGNCFMTANKAMENLCGHDPTRAPECLVNLRAIIAAGRNAFAHDPAEPRFWFEKSKKKPISWYEKIWTYTTPSGLNIFNVDLQGKHNKILQVADFGGIKKIFTLFRCVQDLVKPPIKKMNELLLPQGSDFYFMTDCNFDINLPLRNTKGLIPFSIETFIEKQYSRHKTYREFNYNRLITFCSNRSIRVINLSVKELNDTFNDHYDFTSQLFKNGIDVVAVFDHTGKRYTNYYILNKDSVSIKNEEFLF